MIDEKILTENLLRKGLIFDNEYGMTILTEINNQPKLKQNEKNIDEIAEILTNVCHCDSSCILKEYCDKKYGYEKDYDTCKNVWIDWLTNVIV